MPASKSPPDRSPAVPNFTAVYPESTGWNEDSFSLHAVGCRAAEREHRHRGGTVQTFEAASLDDALGVVIDEELAEIGYSAADVRIHRCAR